MLNDSLRYSKSQVVSAHCCQIPCICFRWWARKMILAIDHQKKCAITYWQIADRTPSMFNLDPEHDEVQEKPVLHFVIFIVPCSSWEQPTPGPIACSPLTCSIYHHGLWVCKLLSSGIHTTLLDNPHTLSRILPASWYVCMFKGTTKTFVNTTSNPWASLEHFFAGGF